MNLLRRYLAIVVAGVALLFGIQVPNFVDQYQKRVDAHLREVMANLQQYQAIADREYQGSLDALIAFHHKSGVRTFAEEGAAIASMYHRKLRFETDAAVLKTGLFTKVIRVVSDGDPELLQEAIDQYSYAIPLNQDAIVCGVVVAATALVVLELCFGVLVFILRLGAPVAARW
jgi:Protein of unknown function (DUF2937)